MMGAAQDPSARPGDRLSDRAPKALYVLDREAFDLVYGPDQQACIVEIAQVLGPAIEARELDRHAALGEVEVLLSGWGAPLLDEALLVKMPALRTVLYGAGAVGNFVTDAVRERGIVVSSANDANAVPVAEYTLAVVLFSLKHGWRFARERTDPRDAARHEVPGAYGSTVGILGLGAIGRLVRERLAPFSLRVLAYDPYCSNEDAARLHLELVGLAELFSSSDVVSVHAPLHDGSHHLVSAELLDAMRAGATFVNTARGALVDHDELARVLEARPDLQAVLDVTDPEPLAAGHLLHRLDNVVVTPHIAGSMGPECRRMGDLVVEELRHYAAGEPLEHAVDLSRLDLAARA